MPDHPATSAHITATLRQGDVPGQLAPLTDDVCWEEGEGNDAQTANVLPLHAQGSAALERPVADLGRRSA